MPRGLRKKTKQYVLDRFQEEDPEAYFQYKTKATYSLSHEQMEFLQAIDGPSPMRVQSMLNRGVDVNFITGSSLKTPLHEAVTKKTVHNSVMEKIVGVMLFFGADPNARDSEGKTAFHFACSGGKAGLVDLLLQAGADVNAEDNMQETPLLAACSMISPQTDVVVKLLLQSGATVSTEATQGQSEIHALIQAKHEQEDLTTAGETEESAGVKARTGLHLLQWGASATQHNDAGSSPWSQELLHLQTLPSQLPEPCLLQVLLLGGAEHDCQIDTFTEILKRPTALKALTFLVSKYHHLMSRSHLRCCLDQLRSVSSNWVRNIVDILVLEEEVDTSLREVLNLTQLSRISIRRSLGGYVLSQAESLPLPSKMKQFLLSYD